MGIAKARRGIIANASKGIAYIQRPATAFNNDSATKTNVINVTGVTQGNTLIISGLRTEASGGIVSVTDDASNTYTVDQTIQGGFGSGSVASGYMASVPTQLTVTWTITTTTQTIITVDEFSGILNSGRKDKSGTHNASSSGGAVYTVPSSALANNAKANMLAFAFIFDYNSPNTTNMTAGSGYTGLVVVKNSTNKQHFTEYKVTTTVEGSQATCSGTASHFFAAILVTYQGAQG